jgi:c(7)-type cytochrome triheme protein
MKYLKLFVLAAAVAAPLAGALAQSGKDIYGKTCVVCHATGLAGAPRFGNGSEWAPRIAAGMARLYNSALHGTPKGMPAKGGNLAYSDAEVKGAVDYMVSAAKAAAPAPQKTSAKEAEAASAPAASSPAAAPKAEPVLVAAAVTTAAAPQSDVNSFNRLLKPIGKRTPPPTEDGIHDPTNDGTQALLPPATAFASLPKSFAGNHVNWVQAIEGKKITPRSDRNDPNAEQVVMDLNIVREVKGSMPDVVYPHKQHTEWLDCSNCHPAIFIPQKGANSISMAAILMGEKCGVCHGKVAFPVSECRLCHSKKKGSAPTPATTTANAGK